MSFSWERRAPARPRSHAGAWRPQGHAQELLWRCTRASRLRIRVTTSYPRFRSISCPTSVKISLSSTSRTHCLPCNTVACWCGDASPERGSTRHGPLPHSGHGAFCPMAPARDLFAPRPPSHQGTGTPWSLASPGLSGHDHRRWKPCRPIWKRKKGVSGGQ